LEAGNNKNSNQDQGACKAQAVGPMMAVLACSRGRAQRTRGVLVGLLLVLATTVAGGCGPVAAPVVPSSWQRGASIYPFSATELDTPAALTSLRQLRSLGADYVTLVVPMYQSSVHASTVTVGSNTPPSTSLVAAIRAARALGLNVMVNFHVDIAGSPGTWRATISPADRVGWFSSYGDAVTRSAVLAQSAGATDLCLGVELDGVANDAVSADNTPGWIALVRRVRTVFHGRLTYDANWDHQASAVRFWNYLDYIGLSGYFPLPGDGSPASLAAEWSRWDTAVVRPVATRWNKRVVFTEVGYRSVTAAHVAPYSWQAVGLPSQAEQANDWTALFAYWSHRTYFGGVQAWQWYADPYTDPRAVPPAATDYAVQGKSAQNVLRSWFGGSQPTR